jgi:predicted esterase
VKRVLRSPNTWLTLVPIAAVELGLFAACLDQRWHQDVLPLHQPPGLVGEGLVVHDNGLGYYAWLRSLLIDGDWSFDNEFDAHAVLGGYVPPRTYRTELGRRANQWSVGPACVWAWSVVPGHYLLEASGLPWEANGYSLPYQILVGATSLAASAAGPFFLCAICRRYAEPRRAALAVALLVLGSTMVHYGAVEVGMAHGLGTTALAALVWYWQKTYGSPRPGRWFLVGVLLGIAALMRWQLATFAFLPAGEALLSGRRGEDGSGRRALGLFLAGAGALLAFLPQMIAWRCVYGHWIASPVPGLGRHWLHPSLWAILFSQDRSLFFWTPISFLACAGAVGLAFRPRQGPARLLLAAFALQVYVLASLWGMGEMLPHTGNASGVHLARSFGMRHLTESLVALAPGLAFLLEHLSGWRFRLLAGLGFALVLWNLLLVLQYSFGYLPIDAGLSLSELVSKTRQFVEEEPGTCLVLVEVVALVWLLLAWGAQRPVREPAAEREGQRQQDSSSPAAPLAPPAVKVLGLFALTLPFGLLESRDLPVNRTGFRQCVHRDENGLEWKYALFLPRGYKGDRPYPLLVYLHGFGARGLDGWKTATDGVGPFIEERNETFDMLALFPQSETGDWEADTADGRRALAILDEVLRDYAVDRQRIYLTGTSRGGFGVWSLAVRDPHPWAAIVPICGGGDPAAVAAIAHLPCWCFHGARDTLVPVDRSRRTIAALRAAGGRPRYTEYPEVGHACWQRAYATPELWGWLARQRLQPAPLGTDSSQPTAQGQQPGVRPHVEAAPRRSPGR